MENGQALSPFGTRGMAMGDLDGDGDLDVVQGNFSSGVGDEDVPPNRVWLNDGNGNFTDSGQLMAENNAAAVALGDLDGDGDLDYMSANGPVLPNRVWLNDGNGRFTDSGQLIGSLSSLAVEFGDVDGDGDLDAYVGNSAAPNRLYLNDGNGQLTDSGQRMGSHWTGSVALGDMDGDGDLDAFVANSGPGRPNRIWLNDGSGVFSDNGQLLGTNEDDDVTLGDMDGDGDLDAVDSNRLWLNDGSAVFTDSGQAIGDPRNRVGIGDVDGDGDLDIFYNSNVVYVLLNDGNGVFTDSGQSLENNLSTSGGLELGDLDSDGDLDTYLAQEGEPDVVWINQNLRPSITLIVDNSTIPEAAGTATITAVLSAAHTDTVTVELGISGTATVTDDYTVSGTQIVIPAGATISTIAVTAVDDALGEPDETVIVNVTSIINGQQVGTLQVTTTILDDDEPPVPDVSLTVDNRTIPEAGGAAVFSVNLSETTTVPVTVNLEISGTATATGDYIASGTQITVPPGATTGSISVTAVQDEQDEPDETVIVDIATITGGIELGAQSVTTTILDDDVPPSFRLSSFTPTTGGFRAQLSAAVDTSVLNLGDTQAGGHGPTDTILVGATTGPIAGSLVVSPDGRGLEFLATGARLAPDTYTITLRSGDNGFRDTSGNILDGNGDDTAGDDFSDTFSVTTNTSEIGVQDFVRGPGQELNLPANSTDGIPITIDTGGAAVRNATFAIDFNPDLLNITGVTPSANMPAGSTATVDTATPGRVMVTFTSPIDLPAGPNQLVNLRANVPTANAVVIYGDQHVLDIHSMTLTNAAGAQQPSIDNDGLHVAAFFGDVSGNGGINASDASQVARVAAALDSGFAEFLLTDPMIVGDVSGNDVINATDASMVARFAVQLPVDEIPPIPGGVVIATTGRAHSLRRLAPFVRLPATVHDLPNAASGSTAVGFEVLVPVPHAAVDAVMTALADAGAADDEDELALALEDAVQQLSASLTLATD